jgi:alpha-tubulin suppressor-like RCC1 family protein
VRRPAAIAKLTATLSLALLAVAATGVTSAAASTTTGQIYAFGENSAGQLASTIGNGSDAPNPVPAPAPLPAGAGPVVSSTAGEQFSLALTSRGQLYSFGSNRFGQLGVAAGSGTANANPVPRQVILPGASGEVAGLAAGASHSLVLTSAGQLFTFGENRSGQLGRAERLGTEADEPAPEQVELTEALGGGSGRTTRIAAGCEDSLVLTSTGQLYSFGSNRYGQLGRAANAGSSLPNPVPGTVALPGATGPVVRIAAGCEHSLALTSTGQLYSFGSNRYGQLGRAANAETSSPNPTPVQVVLPSDAGTPTAIAAGGSHSLVLTTSGQILAFGLNERGQLGNASNAGSERANPVPVRVVLPGASAAPIAIAAGAEHSLAITAGGTLFTFGSNDSGQLGRLAGAGTGAASPTPAQAALPAGTTIDAVAQGSTASFTLAQVADLAVANSSLPGGQVGVPYSVGAEAAGGVGGYVWSAKGLPAGLTIDPASGQISGAPASAGTNGVVLSVTDAFGVSATSTPLLLTIAPAVPPRAFVSTVLTEAQLRASLRQQLGIKGSGAGARIASLRKRRSYTCGFTALTAGALAIDWYYLPPGARLAANGKPARSATGATPVLFASGRLSFPTAGTRRITLKLTTKGRRMLRHRRRGLLITAAGSFTPRAAGTVTATQRFTLAR